MFTGIIAATAKIVKIQPEEGNLHLFLTTPLASEFKIDQSIAHNGVCLTIVGIQGQQYQVTAIAETLQKTTIGSWQVGDTIHIERGLAFGARLDGHLVQGHIDQIGTCTRITPQGGSTLFTFEYDPSQGNITIEKGSITIDGVSLTVVGSGKNSFSVAIIPYTFEHTNFKHLKVGDQVNLEFDVVGKYVAKLFAYQSDNGK